MNGLFRIFLASLLTLSPASAQDALQPEPNGARFLNEKVDRQRPTNNVKAKIGCKTPADVGAVQHSILKSPEYPIEVKPLGEDQRLNTFLRSTELASPRCMTFISPSFTWTDRRSFVDKVLERSNTSELKNRSALSIIKHYKQYP